ncbi:MAG: DoxX family protein [Pseudonocardiaceae bacterium]
MTNISSTAGGTDHRFTRIRIRTALEKSSKAVLSAVRIVVSFLFACHGAPILFGAFGGVDGHGATAPIGSWPIWWAGAIELICGGLVCLGLLTKPAALLCSGAMAFAYFTVHQPQGLLPLQNHGELAALYSWIFLLIAVLGPCPYALAAMLRRGQSEYRPSGQPQPTPS